MGIKSKKDSYVIATTELRSAYENQLNQRPIRIIPGSFEEVDGEKGTGLPQPRTARVATMPVNSGMAFHDDAMKILNELPLTDELLAQSKGQNNIWQLKPKGPASEIEKKFNAFLKALAAQKGCSMASLKKQGFQCESKGEKGTEVNFPNNDMAKLFSQMLNENTPAHQLLSPKPTAAKASDEQRPSSRPSF